MKKLLKLAKKFLQLLQNLTTLMNISSTFKAIKYIQNVFARPLAINHFGRIFTFIENVSARMLKKGGDK